MFGTPPTLRQLSRIVYTQADFFYRRQMFSPSVSNLWLTSSSSSVICQTTGPKPLPKRFLRIVRPRFSSFNWQYPLLFIRSSSNFLRLLPRLLVTSICPFIFPYIIYIYIYIHIYTILYIYIYNVLQAIKPVCSVSSGRQVSASPCFLQ